MRIFTLLLKTLQEAFNADSSVGVLPSTRSNKLANTQWSRIPNALNFKIKLGEKSSLWRVLLGISKRVDTQSYVMPGRNKGMNRYIEHQIIRLRKMKKNNPDAYFRLSFFLIKNSKCFQISAINHVFRNWHRTLPVYKLKKLVSDVKKLAQKSPLEHNMDFKRVYIPKGIDTWRPLGVPTPLWRLYLHMYNNFLHTYLEDHFLESQHGFIPGRGTMSAWKQFFINGIYKAKYIYEIDLEKCFDSMSHSYIVERLKQANLPWNEIWRIMSICKSVPKMPEEELLDESRHAGGVEDTYGAEWYEIWTNSGVAQGSAIGPLLTAYVLIPFFNQLPSLSYADDAIFYDDMDFDVYVPWWGITKDSGIKLNKKKSGWVKREGRWLKPFTFLGLSFDGTNLQANTRKGSTLHLTSEIMQAVSAIEMFENNHDTHRPISSMSRELESNFGESWENLMKGKYWGFIMSRLYNGHWDMKGLFQDFEMTYNPNSWMYNYTDPQDKDITIFNSSTLASYSLFYILRNESGFINLDIPKFTDRPDEAECHF